MSFFEGKSSEKIVSKSSSDMKTVDETMPCSLVGSINFFTEILGVVFVVCFANYWLLIPTLFILVFLYFLRRAHINSFRNLSRLEDIARSQVFNHVNTTIMGLETIRASDGTADIVKMEFDKYQDLHISVWTLIINGSRGFEFWMDILSCTYLAVVIYSFILLSDDVLGGKVGLAIIQSMALMMICQTGMRDTVQLDNNLASVKRITTYKNLPPEGDFETDLDNFRINYGSLDITEWPYKGDVHMNNVSLTYGKTKVLNNVSFDIYDGEKVGIVGKRGSGKSSIISGIYRLADVSGEIIINNVDIKDVGLTDLRSKLSIIPKKPVLFSGTLRSNLDPLSQHSDEELWYSLEEVELKKIVSGLPGGLAFTVTPSDKKFSVKERQLLYLARSILKSKKSKILIVDEVIGKDEKIEKIFKKIIRKHFANRTVISIARELYSVIDSDKVIVVDNGRVAKIGHPYQLLCKDLTTSLTAHVKTFKYLVQQCREQNYKALFNIAKKNYLKSKHPAGKKK